MTKFNLLFGFGLICVFFKITGFNLTYIYYALIGLVPIIVYCFFLNRDIMSSDDTQKKIDKANRTISKAKQKKIEENKRIKEENLNARRKAMGKLNPREARNKLGNIK